MQSALSTVWVTKLMETGNRRGGREKNEKEVNNAEGIGQQAQGDILNVNSIQVSGRKARSTVREGERRPDWHFCGTELKNLQTICAYILF